MGEVLEVPAETLGFALQADETVPGFFTQCFPLSRVFDAFDLVGHALEVLAAELHCVGMAFPGPLGPLAQDHLAAVGEKAKIAQTIERRTSGRFSARLSSIGADSDWFDELRGA